MKKKFTRKKLIKNAASLTFGVGLLLSSFQAACIDPAPKARAAAVAATKAESILANLTAAQRKALEQTSTNDQSGLFVSPEVDLDSNENVSIIVQFNQKPHKVAILEAALKGNSLSDSEAKSLVAADHAMFKKDLKSLITDDGANYKISRTYKNAFNGVSIKLPANKIESLLRSKAVKAIYSNAIVKAEQPVVEAAPSKEARGKGMAEINEFLNINKLHEEGYTGKGIKIAVLDTGVDYNHPDLSPAYKGYRAQPGVDPKTIDPNSVKGWDFIDNDADPMETTYADWVNAGKPNPQSNGEGYYTEHGTHVSGTIVGQGKNDSDYATTGIAPDADFYAYRVLGPSGSGTSDGIVAGIEKAVTDGVHIMNLSLGANYNDPMLVEAIAINNAVLSGVTAVVAAGNAGSGMYTLGTPGNASLSLTVGASDVPSEIATMKATVANQISDLRLMATGFSSDLNSLISPSQPLQIVNIGLGNSWDYFGANARVDGKVVLVQRGGNNINDKILQAKNRGAIGVIVYNNNAAEGHLPFNLGEGAKFVPAFSMTNTDGVALSQEIPFSKTGTISFSDLGKVVLAGDNLADFSSRGPSRKTYDIKPEITAPGVGVLSTVPGFVNNHENPSDFKFAYERMSGTSMATPAVAGISALLLQAKPDLQPEDIKAILMNTADPLSKPYSVYEIGAGRVDPYNAIHSNFEIKVAEKFPSIINNKEKLVEENSGAISFGNKAFDGKDLVDTRTVTLFNKSEGKKTFNVSVIFNKNLRGSKDAEANGVTLKTDSTIAVKGNSKKKTKVTLSIPKEAEKGIYEGYVVYTNKDNPEESYKVPFGVHYVEQGFDYFKLYKRSVPESVRQSSQKWHRGNAAYVSLKSHMKIIDAVISDPKTGKDLGVIGTFDGTTMDEGVEYPMHFFYKGYYFPFTNDPNNPIGLRPDQIVMPKAGQYQFKLIGKDDDGKTYTVTQDFFVDNTNPKFDLHVDGEVPGKQIVEFKDGQATVGVTGHITDDNVEVKQAAGMTADQTQNQIYYSYNSWLPNGMMTLDKDGNASDEIAMLPSGILSVKFEGMDEATNGGMQKQYYFVNEHTPYVSVEANHPTINHTTIVKPGDTFTMTLNANNVSKLMKANYTFSDAPASKITNIALNPEAQKLGAALDVKQTTSGSTISSNVTVNFNGTSGVNGDMPMLDLTIQIPTSVEPKLNSTWDWGGVKSTFTDVNNVTTKPFSNVSPISVLNNQTEIRGPILGEAFLNANGQFDTTRDYSMISPTITIVDHNGREVKTNVVNKSGQFDILGIKPSKEDYTIIEDIPGHFTTFNNFNIYMSEVEGGPYGVLYTVGSDIIPTATAGDVNNDDVIDVMDALEIQTYWGTNKRSADINFDGTVDAKDFAFVEKNYLMQNPWIAAPPKAVKKYKGATLESVKSQLEIQ
ncbi:S8 family serine peptidase [Cytobacillus oceanisediminis]|uniref:S8 family serine peptidase n=1 Tax=Cytobacillus oceanisediminis TaxID=665099 RepID=UPI001D14B0C6|nr:S8 family serine peptidase [Cytobacillus oceanisediminis]MCC3649379.1 S8 family serine peptidase [Cytobacillus oceanisediminis]